VPAGYTVDNSDCENGDPIDGSCTIVNTLNSGAFTVNKDFSDDNPAAVDVTLSCTSGTVTNNPQPASEGNPAVFTVEGFVAGATCTATEPSVPAGYTVDNSDCENGDPIDGSCTIVNNRQPIPPRPPKPPTPEEVPTVSTIGLGLLSILLLLVPWVRHRRSR
jgi:hypothetical protein